MADYNIYIHAIGTGGATNENPTVPWEQRESAASVNPVASQTSGGGSLGIGAFSAARAASFMQNPDSMVSGAVSAGMKALPVIAAAYAVVKIGVKVTDTVLEYQSIETGNYRDLYFWEDIKRIFEVSMHPVSSTISAYKTELKWRIENKRQTLQRQLLGGSIADYRGV